MAASRATAANWTSGSASRDSDRSTGRAARTSGRGGLRGEDVPGLALHMERVEESLGLYLDETGRLRIRQDAEQVGDDVRSQRDDGLLGTLP